MDFGTTCHPAPGKVDLIEEYTYGPKKSLRNSIDVRKRTTNPTVTGTSVLGVKFEGGVAIAADMLGSFGSMARFPGISRMTQVNNNTVVAASGDYADFQFVKDNLELIMIENDVLDDGHGYTPKSIFSFLRMFLYDRRSKFDPLWNTLVVGGCKDGVPFLGYVDKLGVGYEETAVATGYGAYIARPLMERELDNNGRILQRPQAVRLLMECLKVLYYRDARSINRVSKYTSEVLVVLHDVTEHMDTVSHYVIVWPSLIVEYTLCETADIDCEPVVVHQQYEIAVITDDGIDIDSNRTLETDWDVATFVAGYE